MLSHQFAEKPPLHCTDITPGVMLNNRELMTIIIVCRFLNINNLPLKMKDSEIPRRNGCSKTHGKCLMKGTTRNPTNAVNIITMTTTVTNQQQVTDDAVRKTQSRNTYILNCRVCSSAGSMAMPTIFI